MFCRSLHVSFCTFSFGHCVVCSSIYGFWLPLWYLQTLLVKVIFGYLLWHYRLFFFLYENWVKSDEMLKINIFMYIVRSNFIHTSSIVIDRYSNFGNTYLSKEFARVLDPGQIVTSLEHLGTVPGVQAWTTSALRQVFKWLIDGKNGSI